MAENSECLLSILIPTLESRRSLCDRLTGELDRQLTLQHNPEEVEVLVLRDDGTATVGAKRNRLIDQADGQFVVFIDDDDGISEKYVATLLQAIRESDQADCISFAGEITFRGKYPRLMVHSIHFDEWHYSEGRYLRPPCHITPIRREIAARYAFAEIDFAEDMDWTLRMSRDEALSREVLLEDVLYFYHCRRAWHYQWLLDRTQGLRHMLGLRHADGENLRKNPLRRNR